MKRAKYLIMAVMCCATIATLRAQQVGFGGTVMEQAGLSVADFVQLSQPQLYGTARSMAMANAFVSLGGDMASVGINPAGLGMFRTSEVTITPLVTIQRSQNSAVSYNSNAKSRFTLSNVGLLYSAYQGSGTVTSVNLGFSYNRVADLNYRTSFQWDSPFDGSNAGPSILNLMAGQLTVNNLYPDKEGFLGYYGDNYPDLWGAMMAYNAYMINPYQDAEGKFWEADHIGHNARIGHFYDMESIGSINEFAFSGGVNIGNTFYIGATIGIQSVSQKKHIYYGEDYRYLNASGEVIPAVNADGQELIEQTDYMHYNQAARISGTGVNFKIGMIWRPIESLRLGFAVHTPTYYSLEHEYGGQMAAMNYDNDTGKYHPQDVNTDGTWVDAGGDAWQFTSPARLMFGASYTFGTRAVISVDYERDWYNGIRVKNTPFWIPDPGAYDREAFKQGFCGTNTVRIGAEIKPVERWALRAGFALTNSMIRHAGSVQSSPLPDQTLYITAGTGFLLSRRVTLDIAYQYCRTDQSDYRLFYAISGSGLLDAAEPVNTQYTRHNIAFSLSYKF